VFASALRSLSASPPPLKGLPKNYLLAFMTAR
jgi:hypothetical protein